MDIAIEREKLHDVLTNLDEQLEVMFELLSDTLDYDLDYSPESVRFVELLLANLRPGIDDDNELLIDASLYIGEAFKRHTGGQWEISEEKTEGKYGQPYILRNDGGKDFYPFLCMNEYAKHYRQDYFYSLFEE